LFPNWKDPKIKINKESVKLELESLTLFEVEGTSIHVLRTPTFPDSRGEFSRVFDIASVSNTFPTFHKVAQVSFSRSLKSGTFRGLHVQSFPSLEMKAIRVISGSIVDFIVDLNQGSQTFGLVTEIELSESDPYTLIVPAGHAHGIYTTSDNTIVAYVMNMPYDPNRDISINYRDEKFKINLPGDISVISEKDLTAPFLDEVLSSTLIKA
jgi:dTDP-4-dehydrorhamnose 3,5-epimerase